MAKLVVTKEKYGVSVATRIDAETAREISVMAVDAGVSFSKMLGLLVIRGFYGESENAKEQSQEIERLRDEQLVQENFIMGLEDAIDNAELELESERELYRDVAAKFIEEISESISDQVRLIGIYNGIMDEERLV